MKSEVVKIRSQPFQLKKSDFFLIVIPGLIWGAAIFMRQSVINPYCRNTPQMCSKESLLPMDQLSFKMEDPDADGYSYFTQNLSGALAVVVPATWSLSQLALGSVSPIGALGMVGVDLVLVLQAASWNGLFTEFSHLIVQRPRPFVYYDPSQRGIDPAHYTSFYSGHTSFTAAMTLIVFLILLVRGAPLFVLALAVVSGEVLVISTAYFRILAGRHFLTDVIIGALAGTAVAWVVISRHRSPATASAPTILE
jgi:membrane-associated phospholipid phosphatase